MVRPIVAIYELASCETRRRTRHKRILPIRDDASFSYLWKFDIHIFRRMGVIHSAVPVTVPFVLKQSRNYAVTNSIL
jgi:hypothetical protein